MRQDNIVVYKNYLTQETIPFNLSTIFSNINLDNFDARFIHSKIKLRKIKGPIFSYLLRENIRCKEDFYKNLVGDNYRGVGMDTTHNNYELFSCGKFSIQKDIQSYVVLMRSSNSINTLFHRIVQNTIILYNIKNNKLCSIVELSSGEENSKNSQSSKSYLYDRCFTTTIDYKITNYLNIEHSLRNIRSWKELLLALGIKNDNGPKLKFSMFRIDTIGFIRFVQMEEDHVPEVFMRK